MKSEERKHIDQIIFNLMSLANINEELDKQELNNMTKEIYDYLDMIEDLLDKTDYELELLQEERNKLLEYYKFHKGGIENEKR